MKKLKFLHRFMIIEFMTVFAVLAFDLLLKIYSEINLKGNSVPLIKDIINLTYLENRGAAFGILQNQMIFFKIITVLALSAFIFYLYKNRGGNFLLRFSTALVIGGTAGNFVDRVKLGYVRDMIEVQFMDFAVFNIADSALTVGVILFSAYLLFIYKEPVKINPPQKQNITEKEQL